MAHRKHNAVRERFERRCGYCGVSEADTGGQLAVDHYRPIVDGGDDSDGNLVYACFKCNQYEGDFFPAVEDQNLGHRVLHPRLDRIGEHMRLDQQTGFVEPLTETGHFHVALLQLNRPPLVQHRLQRQLLNSLLQQHQLLEEEIGSLTSTITALELHVARPERLLESSS